MGSVSLVDSRFVIRNVFSCGFFSISQTKIYANVETPKRKPGSFVQQHSLKFLTQGYIILLLKEKGEGREKLD
jgi:hypothetical protein